MGRPIPASPSPLGQAPANHQGSTSHLRRTLGVAQAVKTAAERRHCISKVCLLLDLCPRDAACGQPRCARDRSRDRPRSHREEHARLAVCVELSVTTACPATIAACCSSARSRPAPTLSWA